MTNCGNTPATPTISIAGPAINPVVTNDTSGEKLSLNLTLVAGDVITIDCFKRTVIQGASTNRMASVVTGSKFWSLAPGATALRFSADAYDVGTATITFRDAFIGL